VRGRPPAPEVPPPWGALAGRHVSPNVVARVMLAMPVHGRTTVREVADRAGFATSTTWRALRSLRHAGLVTWDDRTRGGLHATAEVVLTEGACPPHDFDLLRQCRRCGLGMVGRRGARWEPDPLRCLSLAVYGDLSERA
jgi:hypothetical protein